MALKVKAKEREIKIGKNPGVYRYVMHNGSGIIPTPTDPEDDQPA